MRRRRGARAVRRLEPQEQASVIDEDEPGDEEITLRACLRGMRGLVVAGLVATFGLWAGSVWRDDDALAVLCLVVPVLVVSLGPILWLRWLSPSPRQRRRYIAAVGLAVLWDVACLTLVLVAASVAAS
jgi:hypothetical protein